MADDDVTLSATDDSSRLSAAVTVAGLAVVFVLSITSIRFAPQGTEVAAWWPAAGVGTALLVLNRFSRWPLVLLGLVVISTSGNAVAGRDLDVALTFGLTNATENLVIAVILGAALRRPWLRTAEDFRRLLLAAVVGATVAGVLAGTAVWLLLDGAFLTTLRAVLASHAASELLILPVALLLTDPRAALPVSDARRWHRAIQVIATLAVFAVVHGLQYSLPLAFVAFPFLIWGAQVLSLRALALEVLAVGVLVTVLTAEGFGPFAAAPLSPSGIGALVQLDVVVTVLIALPLALATAVRQRTQLDLSAALDRERRAVLRLQDLDRSKSRFLSNVSHELRTPLTSILGFTQVLSDGTAGTTTRSQQALLTRVEDNSRRLLDMVESLLTVAGAEPSSQALEPEAVNLGELAQEVVSSTALHRHDRTFRVQITPPVDGVPLHVAGDRAQLERLTAHLVTNAVKFTGDGGQISVSVRPEPITGATLLQVRDDGVGIPADEHDRIFDCFYRASTASSVNLQGGGIGPGRGARHRAAPRRHGDGGLACRTRHHHLGVPPDRRD